MSTAFGKVTVSGTAEDLTLAATAYAGQKQPTPVGDLEPGVFPVEFHSAAEMVKAGATLPDGSAAWGFTFPHALYINRDEPPRHQIYALRHEPFHPIVAANMTASKFTALRALSILNPRYGKHAYPNHESEILCDAFVELFWGQGSILDSFYGDIANADLQKAWDILMKPTVNEPQIPVDPPAPLPLPDPRDEQITELLSQVDTLTSQLAEADAKITAAKAALA